MLQEECFVRSWYCQPFSVSRLGIPGEHINSNWLNEPPSHPRSLVGSCTPGSAGLDNIKPARRVAIVFMHGDSILGLVANERQRAFQAFVDIDLVFVDTLGPAHARGHSRSRPRRRISARREVRRRPGGGLSAKSLSPVHHERGGVAEELAKHLLGLRGQLGLRERPFHQRHPAISGALIDGEGEVSLPESG